LILSDLKGGKFVSTPCEVSDYYCKTTLIVCPLSVVGNWISQIEAHTEKGSILYHVYHGDKRNRDPRYLKSMDVVITTYALMSLKVEDTPLHRVRWRRIVLDEGHIIRSKNTKQSKAACNLVAERKWVLSGTPLQNKLEDLYSLLRFIEFFPFDQIAIWKETFDRPMKQGNPKAMDKFRLMMKGLCLRRTKNMKLSGKPLLELPKIVYLVHKIPFRSVERVVYNKWETKTRKALEEILHDAATGNGRIKGNGMGHMLMYLTRLRQICNHRVLAEKEDRQEKSAVGVDQLRAVLREKLAEDCLICFQPLRTPCITPCKHQFCVECIDSMIANSTCIVCKAPVRGSQVVELPMLDLEDDEESENQEGTSDSHEVDGFETSSKIDALVCFAFPIEFYAIIPGHSTWWSPNVRLSLYIDELFGNLPLQGCVFEVSGLQPMDFYVGSP
jgi:SWI/SNF-related matrix-associated actin-dependent regulator of chromatin subfamily A3